MQGRRISLITWLISLFAVALLAGRPALAEGKISTGDVLKITVVGEDKLSSSYSVGQDGSITLPVVGSVPAFGKTVEQLTADLTKRLKVYYKDPVVMVDVSGGLSTKVYVTGAVNDPGEKSVLPESRLSAVLLVQSKGLTELADRSNATLVRRGQKDPIKLDLDAIVNATDPSKDIIVEPGDTIYIPKRLSGKVRVTGEVTTPGEKDITSDMTVLEAIKAAGDPKETADRTKATLVRKGQTDTIALDLIAIATNADPSKNIKVQDGDAIYLPKKFEGKVSVQGEVVTKGDQNLSHDMSPLDAIRLAGGFGLKADKSDVTVQHKDGTKVKVDLTAEADGQPSPMTQGIALQDGDLVYVASNENSQVEVSGLGITNPGKYSYEPGMRVMDAITKAGSFKERAKMKEVAVIRKDGQSVKANVDRYLNNGDVSQNIPLQKGDIVLVGQDEVKQPKQQNAIWGTISATIMSALIYRSIYR